ncbi:hypothetical protein CVT25_014172 [Psilocybe cyanescens]|uniref:Uncharacterized protein n=1 Tax=Psilocybe cyanescens TaxID=93625 RepID=A0A409XUW2_PSICY|nr:hypothetical protein CVT25_014172 [Psilocybe cyanescens]
MSQLEMGVVVDDVLRRFAVHPPEESVLRLADDIPQHPEVPGLDTQYHGRDTRVVAVGVGIGVGVKANIRCSVRLRTHMRGWELAKIYQVMPNSSFIDSKRNDLTSIHRSPDSSIDNVFSLGEYTPSIANLRSSFRLCLVIYELVEEMIPVITFYSCSPAIGCLTLGYPTPRSQVLSG